MTLSRLWIAMLTRFTYEAGTSSNLFLSVEIGGQERLRHTIEADQVSGQASLHEVIVEDSNIEPHLLTSSAIRVGITGKNVWKPEHLFVWGEISSGISVLLPRILPLAIETDRQQNLSTDPQEGVSSMPLRLVNKGNRNMRINRLLLLVKTTRGFFTDEVPPEFLNSIPEIQIVTKDKLVVLHSIQVTHQRVPLTTIANFYTVPVIFPFTKSELHSQSITLRLKGIFSWSPASIFLFGLDDASGRPEAMVPLVHLPEWPFESMTPDNTTGSASVTLPLLFEDITPEDLAGVAFKSIESKQDTTNDLLQQLLAKMK